MNVRRFPPNTYEKISEAPVVLHPFDPASKRAALAYGEALNRVLRPAGVTAELFGSTDLEIAGKGKWEFALFLTDERWCPALTFLVNHFRSVFVLDHEFALFQDESEGYDIEVIAMRGEVAGWNRAVMKLKYWRENPEARAAYEAGKREHAHSKRAYYRWKDELIAGVLEAL